MLHTQATCDRHVVQQSVRHCQQHLGAPRDSAAYRHHHPAGTNTELRSWFEVGVVFADLVMVGLDFFPQVSSMGITPFFVENVSELQLCAIKLVTAVSFQLTPCSKLRKTLFWTSSLDVNTITKKLPRCFCLQVFSRYEKHRQLILEEIFTSLARLPTSKRSLRNFRCSSFCSEFLRFKLIFTELQEFLT